MHFPLNFCENASPYFFHDAFAPSFMWSIDAPEGSWQSSGKSEDPLHSLYNTHRDGIRMWAARMSCTCEDVVKRWKVARHCEDSRRCRCHATTRSRSYDWVYTRSYIAPASEAQSPRHGFVADLLQQAIQQIHNRSVWWSLGFRRWLQLRSDFDSNGRRIVM